MMLTAVYIALPVLLAACALIKKRPVSSFVCGALIFIFFMAVLPEKGGSAYYSAYETFPLLSGHLDADFELPIGFTYPARLLSMLFPDTFALTAAFSLVFAYGVMKYIFADCDDPAICALIACATGFIPLAVKEPCLFTAAILSAFAFRYASRRQLLRFAAVMLLACCFHFDAILLLPLFVIFLIPAGLPLLLGGSAAAGVLILTRAPTLYFDAIYGEGAAAEANIAICIALAVICAAAGLMERLMAGGVSRAKPEQMIKLLFAAAFLSLCAVFEARLLPVAIICAFPSVISVGGALAKTTAALIKMTFREKSRPVMAGAAALGIVLLGAWYGLLLSGGAYA